MIRRRVPVAVAVAAVLAVALAASAHVAAAASVGAVTSRRLGAWQLPGGTGAPTVLVWDAFTRLDGTNLSGQPTGGGGPAWQTLRGTWVTTANQAQASSNVADAALVVDCGRTGTAVTAVLSAGPSAFSGGVVLAAGATTYLAVDYRSQGGGSMQLSKVTGTTATQLATAGGVGSPGTVTLTAALVGGTVTVAVGGVDVLSVALSAADRATYGANTRVGLFNNNEGRTRYDDFRCEAP